MLKPTITITDEVIQQVKEKLVASTKNGNRSGSDIVKQMKNEIRVARKAGKTWKEIETILADAGINVSRPTLAAQCPPKKTVKKKKEGGVQAVKAQKENAAQQPATKKTMQTVFNGNGSSASFEIKPDRTDL